MKNQSKFPAIFVGHGNPMNAIEENDFVHAWRNLANSFEKPEAIVCISAHWETKGTYVTAMQNPKTIHDFGGFPDKLYQVQYPAPGNPSLANTIKKMVKSTTVEFDNDWGFDHGCWSVLKQMYPNADIPIVQLSLDYTKKPEYHFNLAKELSDLRNKGILIIGSGNIVHNLRLVDWHQPNGGFSWAKEANDGIKQMINNEEFEKLCNYAYLPKAYQMAIPSAEHFLPLLYILALKENDEPVRYFNDQVVMGSLSMTSIKIG